MCNTHTFEHRPRSDWLTACASLPEFLFGQSRDSTGFELLNSLYRLRITDVVRAGIETFHAGSLAGFWDTCERRFGGATGDWSRSDSDSGSSRPHRKMVIGAPG